MHLTIGIQVFPTAEYVARNGSTQLHGLLDIVRELAQHEAQAVGSVIIVELTLIGITEDGGITVVGSHNDITSSEIKDIGRGHAVSRAEGISQVQFVDSSLGEHGLVLDKVKA